MPLSTQLFPQSLSSLDQLDFPKGSVSSNSRPPLDAPQGPLATRFGARLKALRLQKGMTQLQVATEFGIDRTFLSDLERGRKSVSLPFLEVFALGFGLSLSELLDQI